MEGTFIEALLEFGAMGLFAGFLVWQHLSMQKRLDKLVEKFQSQLEGIQTKAEVNEEKLRDRYDTVISGLQEDKTTFRVNVAEQVANTMRNIDSVKDKMDALPFDAIRMQIESISLNQRNAQIILEKGMEEINKIQEEAKLKAMARKLTDKE